MRICRNKRSGKYFIFIDDVDRDRILAVTPTNEIKQVEAHLFGDLVERDEETLIPDGIVSQSQVEVYRAYQENRRLDASEKLEMQRLDLVQLMIEHARAFDAKLRTEASKSIQVLIEQWGLSEHFPHSLVL